MAVIVTSADKRQLAEIFQEPECRLSSMEVEFMTSFQEDGKFLNVFALHICALMTVGEFVEKITEAGFTCEIQ